MINRVRHWFTKARVIQFGTTILLFVILAAANTLIGNIVAAMLVDLWGQIVQSIRIYAFVWLVTSVAILGGIIGTTYWWGQSRILKDALTTATNVETLDDSLLRLLADLVSATDIKSGRDRLLEDLLRDAVRMFPVDIYRGAILLPDSTQEYLRMEINYSMSGESIRRTRFYIGPDNNRKKDRGTVGNTFLDKQLRVGHIIKDGTNWDCDLKDFIKFDETRPHPSYYSLINVPIIALVPQSANIHVVAHSTATCLGVICFDSNNARVFDLPETKALLQVLGRRIAATLAIYKQLAQSRGIQTS